MEYLQVILSSLFSLAALFILTKINGNRQISELTMFDYVVGISIGSISAEMATELEKPLKPLVAMVVYAIVLLIISFATAKFLPLRRMLFGRSIVLIRNGHMLRGNFKRAHLDLNEFLVQCRTQGYFDLSAIHTAVLEPNGKLSVLPYSGNRPATPRDLKLTPSAEDIFFSVIIDGELQHENLKASGFDENWLKNELKSQGKRDIKKIFFGALDKNGTLRLFEMDDSKTGHDYFE